MEDLSKKTLKELKELKNKKKTELYEFAQNVAKEKEKNVSKVRVLKKEIARISTALTQKEKEDKTNG